MTQISTKATVEGRMREKLTLVIFKDHLSSRTLHVSLSWLRRLSVGILAVIVLTILASALFIRGYQKSISAPGAGAEDRAEELEKQLAELKTSYEALQARSQAGAPTTASGTTAVVTASGGYFSAIPNAALRSNLPPREILPFKLEALKAQWRGSTLNLSSAIEYTKDDGGNQQGHFVILARGPQNVFAYPDGVFSPAGTDVLIKPDAGEYFSVSRYREIKAPFGPVEKREDIQSIEILIFDANKQLIFVERVGIESIKPREAPAPVKKKEEPAAEASSAPSAANPPLETPAPQATGATPNGNP